MIPILSACLVLYYCGDELTHALHCIQKQRIRIPEERFFVSDEIIKELI